jgi:hypothetical protein
VHVHVGPSPSHFAPRTQEGVDPSPLFTDRTLVIAHSGRTGRKRSTLWPECAVHCCVRNDKRGDMLTLPLVQDRPDNARMAVAQTTSNAASGMESGEHC